MISTNNWDERSEQESYQEDFDNYSKKYRIQVIPTDLLYDNELTPEAKLLFFIIYALAYKEGYCFASNEGLSERICLGLTSVKKYLKELKTQKLILIETYKLKRVIRRRIFIQFDEVKRRSIPKG